MQLARVSRSPQTSAVSAAVNDCVRERAVRRIAFLRGINVGGHRVKMEVLRRLFEELGFHDVSTFIASGNVVFGCASGDAAVLERAIEDHLQARLGYEVATFVRSLEELQAIVAVDPFVNVREDQPRYVVLLHAPPNPSKRAALASLRGDIDEFRVEGREIHWLCRGKLTDSPAFQGGLAKALGSAPTTMRKVTTLRRMAARYGVATS